MSRSILSSGMLTGFAPSLTLLATMFASQQVAAHGYIVDPPERAHACNLQWNKDCEGATYEAESVGEAQDGFPHGNIVDMPDGRIASGGTELFFAMDIQVHDRWYKNEIKDRNINFDWYYTLPHKTRNHEYYITKSGWDQNAPLARASFDLTPFCTVEGNNQTPRPEGTKGPADVKHNCTIPADRTGHHIILGVWNVGNNPSAFHKVVDVNIIADVEPGPVDGWKTVGNIVPTSTLKIGDKVNARAFVGGVESPPYSVGITIDSDEEGKPDNWSYKLATAVNTTQQLIKAGVYDPDVKVVTPTHGTNGLYAQDESGVNRYEVEPVMMPDPGAYMHIHSINPEFVLDKGKVNVDFTVMTNRKLNIKATVVDTNNKTVGEVTQIVDATSAQMSVPVTSSPGAHSVLLVGSDEDGRINLQDVKKIELTGEAGGGDHEFVYPEGVGSYKAGTKVLAKDGNVYECKPHPYTAWCNGAANYYEPGVGLAWGEAWIKK